MQRRALRMRWVAVVVAVLVLMLVLVLVLDWFGVIGDGAAVVEAPGESPVPTLT